MSAQVRSSCSLDLSLAGDNDHDVIDISVLAVLSFLNGVLRHAQLEVVSRLDSIASLTADSDTGVSQS